MTPAPIDAGSETRRNELAAVTVGAVDQAVSRLAIDAGSFVSYCWPSTDVVGTKVFVARYRATLDAVAALLKMPSSSNRTRLDEPALIVANGATVAAADVVAEMLYFAMLCLLG
jgi:hypothetical protein